MQQNTRTANWADLPMLDLHLSLLEVKAAEAVFMKRIKHFYPFTLEPPGSSGYMSLETVVACALAEVWRQGRRYQRDQDTAALFELAGLARST